MENEQTVEKQEGEVENILLELTPEQESEMLVVEFDGFAKSLEAGLPYISAGNGDVADKLRILCTVLRSFNKEEMLVIFNAIDAANPIPALDEEE